MATTWKRYTIGNERTFKELLSDEEIPWPTDDELRAAGFQPDDEEAAISLLAEEWNGHPAGSRVIHSLILTDYPFAVEVKGDAEITWETAESVQSGRALIVGRTEDGRSVVYVADADGAVEIDDEQTDGDYDGEGWPWPPKNLVREAVELAVGSAAEAAEDAE